MNNRFLKLRLIILVLSVFVLLGCGYKGPLYLPKDRPVAKGVANNQYTPKVESQTVNLDESATSPSIIESKTNNIISN